LIEINTAIQSGTRLLDSPLEAGTRRHAIQTPKRGPTAGMPRPRSGDIRVQVERGLTVPAENVADLRALSDLPPGLILVIHDDPDPRFSMVRLERP
jgi:hypothetical protein